MPQLDESVAAHLCPPTAIGWKAKASHPSKLCRTTSALAGRSYASAGQAASALHSMAVLQVYQAKLLSAVDESEPDPATLRELRSTTDLALRATKTTAQAMRAAIAPERALAIQKLAATFKSDTARPLKVFQRMLGLMAAASPVLQLGLLHMRPLQRWLKPRVPHNAWHHGRLHIRVNQACVTALTTWKNPRWMKKGVAMGLVHTRKVVTTDASNTGWGALYEGKLTFGHWSKAESGFHINCLEMLAVCRACQFFLPDLIGRHVLIRSDNMSVVSYINRQGGVSSKRLFILAERLLEWAQLNLRSLRAAHLPGRLNQGADMLSRSNVPSEEWMLHPQVVQKIWKTFGKAEVDLFASKDNSHCPTYYSKDRDNAHDWPNLLLYAFPPIALLPQVVRRVREQGHKVLLVAPLWRNQPWLSELTQLLTAAPWPVPLRQDLLSQANGTIWHPRPELWALYIWPLNGSLLASQSEC